jgi:hypothetical protein
MSNSQPRTREVLLVVEESYHYYIPETESDEDALDKAKEMLDNGEPDQNPACGWIKVLRHEVKTVDSDDSSRCRG